MKILEDIMAGLLRGLVTVLVLEGCIALWYVVKLLALYDAAVRLVFA